MSDKNIPTNSNINTSELSEDNFELLLHTEFSNLVPNKDIINSVNPWKKYMKLCLLGIFFSFMNNGNTYINLLALLTAVIGFKGLRSENHFFYTAYISEFMCFFLQISLFLTQASIHNDYLLNDSVLRFYKYATLVLSTTTYLSLWLGIRQVEIKAQITRHSLSPLILTLWYIIVFVVIITFGEQPVFINWFFLASYVLIFICLFMTYKRLCICGYSITPTKIKIPNIAFAGIIILFTFIALIGILLNNHYPMEWTLDQEVDTQQVTDAKEHLSKQGVPTIIIDDLSNDEILELTNAYAVRVSDTKEIINEKKSLTNDGTSSSTADVTELHFTNVSFLMSANGKHWRTIHHFTWKGNPTFPGTDTLMIYGNETGNLIGDISGRLLCKKDDSTYVSDYYILKESEITYDFMVTSETIKRIAGTFSFNKKADTYSGYIIYDSSDDYEDFHSTVEYCHQNKFYIYPMETSLERSSLQTFSTDNSFVNAQSSIYFDYPIQSTNSQK